MTKDEICGLLRQIHDVLAMQSETNHWAQPTPAEYAMGYAEGFNDGCKPKPEQEPVAWYYPDGSPEQCTTDKAYAEMEPAWTPLYTIPPPCPTCEALARTVMLDQTAHDTPPKRTWVGLTYEDMTKLQKDLYDAKGESVLPTTFAMAVEDALRKKNR